MSPTYSLMVHGGAGEFKAAGDPSVAEHLSNTIRQVLEQGRVMLADGADALDTVEVCAALLEDDPAFNAGRGSTLNETGRVEMDAAIMDGRTLAAGAVAAIRNIANPVRLARRVLDEGRHVIYAGEGALRFAERLGVATVDDDYFLTPRRLSEFQETLDRHGTIGAVARDRMGNLAAATSTGGYTGKATGRIGDSPIIGAGTWADNASCAVSCTGHGEDFLRTTLAKTAADFIELQGMKAETATARAMEYLTRKVDGHGGLILIDRHGRCARAFNTPRMVYGWIEHGGEIHSRL